MPWQRRKLYRLEASLHILPSPRLKLSIGEYRDRLSQLEQLKRLHDTAKRKQEEGEHAFRASLKQRLPSIPLPTGDLPYTIHDILLECCLRGIPKKRIPIYAPIPRGEHSAFIRKNEVGFVTITIDKAKYHVAFNWESKQAFEPYAHYFPHANTSHSRGRVTAQLTGILPLEPMATLRDAGIARMQFSREAVEYRKYYPAEK